MKSWCLCHETHRQVLVDFFKLSAYGHEKTTGIIDLHINQNASKFVNLLFFFIKDQRSSKLGYLRFAFTQPLFLRTFKMVFPEKDNVS